MTTTDIAKDLGIASRMTRSRGRTGRNENANARLTRVELDELKAAAKAQGKALGEWNREVLLREARQGFSDRAIFTELIAMRMFLNMSLRAIAVKTAALTDISFSQILAEAKKEKHQGAADVLTQYQNHNGGN